MVGFFQLFPKESELHLTSALALAAIICASYSDNQFKWMASENNYTHSSSPASKMKTEAGKGAFAYSALVKRIKYSAVCYCCILNPGHSAAVSFDIA